MPIGLKMRGAAVVFLAAPLVAGDAEFCIGGTVVNAMTGEPIRRAGVTTPQSAALTDAAGVFRFCGLPAGSYYANAEKPGFAAAGSLVTVGPSRADVQLRLEPMAVIKGRVLDGDGEPLEHAIIQLLSPSVREGRRKVRVESVVTTDDRGEYRLPGLVPGRYLVKAAGWQGADAAGKEPDSNETFVPVYYGGATDLASASPLTAEPGREVSADFSVVLGPSYRIRGSVAGYSSVQSARIELLRQEEDASAARIAFNTATGAFEISHVAPGSYILRATQGEGAQRRRAEQAVHIGASDMSGVILSMAAAVSLKGTVRVAQVNEQVPLAPNCSVSVSPAGASMSDEPPLESTTGEDGAFEIAGVLPGHYRIRMDCANGYIAAAHAGDTDLLARDELVIVPGTVLPPLDAALGTDGGTLDITATQNDEAATAWLLLLPDSDNDLHARFSIVRGKLTVSGVAPGDYQAYAWTGSPEEFEYANPGVRQAWATRAVTVHVDARQRQSIALKIPAGESH